jgi:hypothetical protein
MPFINAPLLSVVVIAGVAFFSQTFPTIPEALTTAKTSLTRGASIPSGTAPTLDSLLSDTDLIVRGVVGVPHSYLSDDQRSVLSDYPVTNASIVYKKNGLALGPSTTATTVTLFGGVVEINGLTFTDRPSALPALDPGNEHVLCLRAEGGKFLVALRYFGAFAIRNGHLAPLTRKNGFAPEAQQLSAEQMLTALKSRAEALHARRPQ